MMGVVGKRLGFALALLACVMFVACTGRDDYRLGKEAFDRGDFAKAAAHFQKAAEQNPGDIRPLKKLATIYWREEKYDEAARVLEKARELDPQDGELAVRLAYALAKAGRSNDALVASHHALEVEAIQKDEKLRKRLEELIAELEGGSRRNATQAASPSSVNAKADGLLSAPLNSRSQLTTAARDLSPCAPLPTPPIRREDLLVLVPDDSPGRVIIRWRTETQEENLGFNIYRSENPDGPYERINRALIPGEGSTNIPKDYCFEDKPLPRGQVYYYYIETVSTAGVREILEGTKGTRVKVKSVEEEREWLWRKVMGDDKTSTQTSIAKPSTATRSVPTTNVVSSVAHFTLTADNPTSHPAAGDPLN
ncbi:MAG: tetratricopeptide repeat protein [Candidatus Sumerlaeaceae bacterium]|nr:tetratricopeptide repeat protein [Candidatus Sumerlaeaceae bacterium]